ncbi:aspartate/glutamate racemase family protein [uncultured Sphingomonas sp.]|uniref:aspartate/glutamate racemase family protein n=1 Tax=uncultured Sphingomonas sp. TaxID=158754 RepID=UPI0025F7177E|nr:aspartate/glutamate racemase family protein [uncultured Sphingomonas sp.]
MRTIGLIGGMSWESSAYYYSIINREVRRRLGGMRSAKSVMVSLDFAEIAALQHDGDWDMLGRRMADAAAAAERGGAEIVALCTNTMHRVADAITEAINVPFIHIADPTAAAVKAAGFTRVGLLGTAFTMEQPFYVERLRMRHGLDVIVPTRAERGIVHDVIYRELVQGEVLDASRALYRDVIARLIGRGAEAIILGCTEIMLLVGEQDSAVPLFDTTELHARALVDASLA